MAKGKGKGETKNKFAGQSKAEKFSRLGTARTTKALKALQQIKRLAGNGYESTPEQQKKIVESLTASVASIKDAFAGKREVAEGFKL